MINISIQACERMHVDCAKKKNSAVIFILRVTGDTSFNVARRAKRRICEWKRKKGRSSLQI
jgi:hypothetical protein